MSPPRAKPDFMMPVAADSAALQFFTEAMRANTSVMEKLREEASGDRHMLHEMNARLIRIESNQVDRRVLKLEEDVAEIKADHQQEQGAKTALVGFWKHAPTALGYIIAMIAAVVVFLKASGRI